MSNVQPVAKFSPALHKNKLTLTALGLVSLITGCKSVLPAVQAQTPPSPSPTNTPSPTSIPSPTSTTPPTTTPSPTVTPTATPWPTPTMWPSPTSWPTPVSWQPAVQALPTLVPIPVVPTQMTPLGLLPTSYAPPDGVDVFGNIILRWEYHGQLAPNEFFDIKIKPVGSNDSVFVDWTKATEYELHPWSGWSPGLYTWQIGIVRGSLEGETKRFIADTGRDSTPFIIKWQPAGAGGSGNGGGNSGGGGSSGGS